MFSTATARSSGVTLPFLEALVRIPTPRGLVIEYVRSNLTATSRTVAELSHFDGQGLILLSTENFDSMAFQ